MAKFFLASLLILGFLGTLAFGFTRDAWVLPSVLLDSPAPEFVLEVMSPAEARGRNDPVAPDTVRLSSLRGHGVVLNFWASWCLACRQEHASLSQAADRYRARGVRFIGVLYQDTPENARRWIVEQGGQSYPTVLDPRSRTAINYGLYGVPETYFISPDGIIVHKHIGPVTREILDNWIQEIVERPSEQLLDE